MNGLKQRRVLHQLTQPQLAAKLREVEPRIDVGMVSRYEGGVCLPTGPQIGALEVILEADRLELWGADELNLLGSPAATENTPCKVEKGACKAEIRRLRESIRKCFRLNRAYADQLPDDLLAVLGYVSWQQWFDRQVDNALRRYKQVKRKEG